MEEAGVFVEGCVIYGSGKWGRAAFRELYGRENILFFVDRAEEKQGTLLFGHWIFSPEVLRDYPGARVYCAVENDEGIREYLHELGISDIVSYCLRPEDERDGCIVYGSEKHAEEFLKRYGHRFEAICFVDDALYRMGRRFRGKTVYPLGQEANFPEAILVDAGEGGSLPEWHASPSQDCMTYRPGIGLVSGCPRMKREAPGILVVVAHRLQDHPPGGIGRVADELLKAMGKDPQVIPVGNLHGILLTEGQAEQRQVDFLRGDRLFLLEPPWREWEDFAELVRKAKENGVRVFGVVHDFLPEYHPEFFTESISGPFFAWHDMILALADGIICPSEHTAGMAEDYCRRRGIHRGVPLEIHVVRHGTSFPRAGEEEGARRELLDFARGRRMFLMLGTLEPRKGHRVVLEAFRSLWREMPDLGLLILGREGWHSRELRERMAPYLGKTVLWVRDASDAEVQWACRRAEALIAASFDEGFGLPLVEAASFGLPILCSDIEVFREVTQGHALYFPAGDSGMLAKLIKTWRTREVPDSAEMEVASWGKAAEKVLGILRGRALSTEEANVDTTLS